MISSKMFERYSVENLKDWLISGVDASLAGNGGDDCVEFLPSRRRFIESAIGLMLACVYIYFGWRNINVPALPKVVREDRGGKRALTVLMCFTFGLEVGFKFASKTLIYLLNPCHIITTIQIYLLAAPPTSRLVTVMYRVHMHFLHGAVLAILLPVLNTRLLPFEAEVYWIQHGAMLVIPFYFLRLGGVYTVEKLNDFSWSFLTLGCNFFYHFVVLQPLGMIAKVNLNNVVCPAITDPFYGQNYRVWAMIHQSLLILIVGKIYTAISLKILGYKGRVDGSPSDVALVKSSSTDDILHND